MLQNKDNSFCSLFNFPPLQKLVQLIDADKCPTFVMYIYLHICTFLIFFLQNLLFVTLTINTTSNHLNEPGSHRGFFLWQAALRKIKPYHSRENRKQKCFIQHHRRQDLHRPMKSHSQGAIPPCLVHFRAIILWSSCLYPQNLECSCSFESGTQCSKLHSKTRSKSK